MQGQMRIKNWRILDRGLGRPRAEQSGRAEEGPGPVPVKWSGGVGIYEFNNPQPSTKKTETVCRRDTCILSVLSVLPEIVDWIYYTIL